ncbi:GNAT family N-acetyltransferase [uncultured Pontibacter sp.]|uniref:GNAT family N-acetyltransferase n=1 Tax=uncultured Pontibacter sp. TaxID=453356 RepID=UPI002614FE64|nr:GNAT family N-acetyltransferase [uncultured Pontibacter sp.]
MEKTYTFSFLREQDIPELHDTFHTAFSDYMVPIKLTREDFAMKIKREGIQLTFCVGAYFGQKLVGFVLTGIGEWLGKPTAYNAGTGVVPEHRSNRLTQRIYAQMLPKLRESGIEQCLLEVIQENTAALKAYQTIGFEITRSLDCFRGPKEQLLLPSEVPKHISTKKAVKPNWGAYEEFCDIHPTWQNTKQAYKLSPDRKLVLEAYSEGELLVGYAAFFPRTGAVAQLAVQQGFRNRGVATALLQEVVHLTEAPALMVLNVDTACPDMIELMARRHLTRILGQYEMLLPL